MKNQINRKYLNIYDYSFSIENFEKLIYQLKNNICKIKNKEKKELGIGILCKIKYKSKKLKMLIINKDIINENDIKNKNSFLISFNNKEDKEIKLDNKRKKIIIKELNIILIEIKLNIDKIKIKYFNILNDIEDEIYSNIYLIYYSKENNINISFCSIKEIKDNFKNINNNLYNNSFIFSIKNNKLIGI